MRGLLRAGSVDPTIAAARGCTSDRAGAPLAGDTLPVPVPVPLPLPLPLKGLMEVTGRRGEALNGEGGVAPLWIWFAELMHLKFPDG